jgi:hypothetical protein
VEVEGPKAKEAGRRGKRPDVRVERHARDRCPQIRERPRSCAYRHRSGEVQSAAVHVRLDLVSLDVSCMQIDAAPSSSPAALDPGPISSLRILQEYGQASIVAAVSEVHVPKAFVAPTHPQIRDVRERICIARVMHVDDDVRHVQLFTIAQRLALVL